MVEFKEPFEISLLVVEDDAITRELIVGLLRISKLSDGKIKDIYEAGSGIEGLESYKNYYPDIVITDVRMPEMDGIMMAKEIKNIDPASKFIVSSAYNELNYLSDSIDIGINQYIFKPIDIKKVTDAIEKLMQLIKMERKISYQNEKLRLLTSELAVTQEKERNRIAKSLDDTVLQNLALSIMELESIKKYHSDPDTVQSCTRINELINRSIEFSRGLIFELSPPVLYELGLEAALDWLIENFQKKEKILIKFNQLTDKINISMDMRIFLYRSVNELLINVVKHAKAREVILTVYLKKQALLISVEDDGIGFNPENIDIKMNYGLFSIKERLLYNGGSMEIKSEKGKGTKVTMNTPLNLSLNV